MFYQVLNNAKAKVAAAYSPDDGFIELDDGSTFGTPTEDNPVLFSTFAADGTPYGVYAATGRSSNQLTDITLISGTDHALAVNDLVEIRWTADHVKQLTDALSNLVGRPDSLALGPHSTAINDGCIAAGEGCFASGQDSASGSSPVNANISGTDVTVTNFNAVNYNTFLDLYNGAPVVFYGLSGGSGPRVHHTTINSAVNVSGNTATFTIEDSTDQLSGQMISNDAYTFASSFGMATTSVGNGAIATGWNTLASQTASFTHGIGSKTYLPSQVAYASGSFSSLGTAQASKIVVYKSTSDGTPTELLVNGNQHLKIPTNRTWAFDATIIARKDDGTSSRFKRSGLITNISDTVALVSTVQTIGTDINTPTWSIAITADDTNKSLKISATGAAATNIHWVACVELTEAG